MDMRIILATSSRHRKQAFKTLGIKFSSRSSRINEKFSRRPVRPAKLVALLAKMKAESVAKNEKDAIVLGFDSVGWHKGKILEKPSSQQEAIKMLLSLSGKTHEFYTGVHIIRGKRSLRRIVKTGVTMRKLSFKEVEKYIKSDRRFRSYAIGYDPIGSYASCFVERIEGSYNNLLFGIPLETVVPMLRALGFQA